MGKGRVTGVHKSSPAVKMVVGSGKITVGTQAVPVLVGVVDELLLDVVVVLLSNVDVVLLSGIVVVLLSNVVVVLISGVVVELVTGGVDAVTVTVVATMPEKH